MALGVRPFFNLKIPAVLGELSFDRNGYVHLPGELSHWPTPTTQPKPLAPLGGPATRQLVKNVAANPGHWHTYLTKALSSSDRPRYLDSLRHYNTDSTIDHTAWEAAAGETGLDDIYLDEASEAELTPGAQLFALVSNLSGLGLLAILNRSKGNAGLWKEESIG